MNYIFVFLILISFICAIITNRVDIMVNELLKATDTAVKIAFSLIGIMGFWLGIVNIAKKTGLMEIFSKIIKKPITFLFPDLKNNDSAISNIALNISANAFGLANAATPFGIAAIEDMQKDNQDKKTATNSMCLFLAMNTAGFQIIPMTVLAILVSLGASDPFSIIIPTMIVTAISFLSAIFFAKLLEKYSKKSLKGAASND